ncbi:hypothetical protein IFW43_000940 [Salmonella enterica]|nr:hypothetical protein [Salmonella enterica]
MPYISLYGKDEKVRFERQRESVAAGNDPKGEARSAESSFPHHHHFRRVSYPR